MRAWIETSISSQIADTVDVALRVRAWIETPNLEVKRTLFEVALRVRAWIETIRFGKQTSIAASPSA